VSRVLAALVMALAPAMAEACATCIGSPFGDRTYNWPYLGLILLPFAVAAVIGTVFVRVSGESVSTLVRRFLRLIHPSARQEERT
jgi:hypothetical protein